MSQDNLQEQLEKLREMAKERNPSLFLALEEANREIYETGILETALKLGDSAPDFILQDAIGLRVSLSNMLKRGNIVLTFYRGEWCPYCNLALRSYQKIFPDILGLNASLLAISPQSPKHAMSLTTKHQLGFHVLSDIGNETARAYRLVYEMPESLRQVYESRGHDMIKEHGSWQLPLAATFVIDQNAKIRYRFLNVDMTKRAEPSEILAILREI